MSEETPEKEIKDIRFTVRCLRINKVEKLDKDGDKVAEWKTTFNGEIPVSGAVKMILTTEKKPNFEIKEDIQLILNRSQTKLKEF